jgi:UDP-2,3-diacylglucosamine pyrophosphatase LpxH
VSVVSQTLYALSDLHLQAPIEPFLFTEAKEAIFVRVAAEAHDTGARLLIGGDAFDLTGMTPPPNGLRAFFEVLGLTLPARPTHRGVAAQLAALEQAFPALFESLRPLAATRRLHFIAGNHDCAIASEAGRTALGSALGVAPGDVSVSRTFRHEDILFACHGNEFDESNSTEQGCLNPGAVMAAALYHAVIPALDQLGFEQVAHAVPAVRPEENIVLGLEQFLGADRAAAMLRALVALLLANGYFNGWSRAQAWLTIHALPWLVSTARVRKVLADDTDLKAVVRDRAVDILNGRGVSPSAGPAPSTVVMGHTHELDATGRYVNLGTWIDHVRGLAPADIVCVERALPVLVATGSSASLHDCQGLSGAVTDAPLLWKRDPDPGPAV